MKSRWMVMSLVVAALVAVGGLKAAKEEAKEGIQSHLPRFRQAGRRRPRRRTEERRQGLLLLRQLPEGVQGESRRSTTCRSIANCSRPDKSCKSPARLPASR